jgi:transketolase
MSAINNYTAIAKEARLTVLRLIYEAQTSHIGSNFSAIDILTVLFSKIDLNKDKLILSAGWKAAALYFFLWKAGKITEDELNSYCKDGSEFIGLAEPIIPEIPFSGGSMGLGFPAAVGFALAKKLKGESGHIYCLMSDGELQSGTTWEAALIAAQHKLSNLTVIVDWNGWQAMGRNEDILKAKFPMDGWQKRIVEGHDFEEMEQVFSLKAKECPRVIIAHTTKGKGVSFMENENIFHYRAPNEDEYKLAKTELV